MGLVNVSRLYWNAGIGWPTILFALLMYYFIYLSDGWLRWVFIVISFFWTILAVYRVRRWTASPWRKVHFKSMLVYATLSGREAGEAKSSNRDFNVFNPIYSLLHTMVPNNDKEAAENIFEDIRENGSNIMYHILDRHIRGLLPLANEIDLQSVMIEAANSPVSPHLAIACIIEYEHGTLEAAKYIIAVLKNEAS